MCLKVLGYDQASLSHGTHCIWVDTVPFSLVQLSGTISLFARGDCEFSVKAQVAQLWGAKAMMVINDDEEIKGCGIGHPL
ncbi:hypothetical protein L3X38_011067 [Prunus dulcis]|uniref:PA domain-containing protein n=1 Tax=Prunus dulcis TaxID=3755 RepID=A0AAD4ZF14_PRUDU|nr:hypothetical protein L3X38_011067 [Prunus dulcis]